METALGRLRRMEALSEENAVQTLAAFRKRWPSYIRLPVLESTTSRAGELAWQHGLRGYDVVHLATAVLWQEALEEVVMMVSYDRRVLAAAHSIGLESNSG